LFGTWQILRQKKKKEKKQYVGSDEYNKGGYIKSQIIANKLPVY
jgi:hypothetical protein